MRDRILDYLRKAGEPVAADKVLLDVLQIQTPSLEIAQKVLDGIIGEGAGNESAPGPRASRPQQRPLSQSISSRSRQGTVPPKLPVLFIEGSQTDNNMRGAIHISPDLACEFDTSGGYESVQQVFQLLKDRPLAAWDESALRRWKYLLRCRGLPDWQGEFLSIRSLAGRVLHASRRNLTAESMASRLNVAMPGDCPPPAMARFFSESLFLLIERAPLEIQSDTHALIDWGSGGTRKPDYSRFNFGPEFLNQIPESPGVYIMRDSAGAAIYVGKSRNLKRRVGSYFGLTALEDSKIDRIHDHLHSLEFRCMANEVEALLLEMRLIRRLHPVINLQTEIHSRSRRRSPKNLLLIVAGEAGRTAAIYFLYEGRFAGKRSARLHYSPKSKLCDKIKSVFFSNWKARIKRDAWEVEIVSRWLSQNSSRLNWIDVDECRNYREVIGRLKEYLNDPDELRNKVYYR